MISRDVIDHHVFDRRRNCGSLTTRRGNLGQDQTLGTELGDIDTRAIGQHVAHDIAVVGDLRDASDPRRAYWEEKPG